MKVEVKMASVPISYDGITEGGTWENERACGPISWIMCVLFSPLALICCGPFDVRKVYTAGDGTKYDDCGKLMDEKPSCLCPALPSKGAYDYDEIDCCTGEDCNEWCA